MLYSEYLCFNSQAVGALGARLSGRWSGAPAVDQAVVHPCAELLAFLVVRQRDDFRLGLGLQPLRLLPGAADGAVLVGDRKQATCAPSAKRKAATTVRGGPSLRRRFAPSVLPSSSL